MADAPPALLSGPGVESFPCDSSYLQYAKYDSTNLRLEIGFKYGGIVQHWPTYPQTWIDFKVAPSKGKFYHASIKIATPSIRIK